MVYLQRFHSLATIRTFDLDVLGGSLPGCNNVINLTQHGECHS